MTRDNPPAGARGPDRWALVTGGAVRIGAALCRAFASRGYHILIHCRSSRDRAEELKDELSGAGVSAAVLQADLRDGDACERLVDEARAITPRLEVLVNNAAVFHLHAMGDLNESNLLDEFRPNLFAPMLLTQAYARRFDGGLVVNMLDRRIASLDAAGIPYVLAKKALWEFTRLAAKALAPRFRVNGIAPGPILPPPGRGEDYLREHGGGVPLEVVCGEEDVSRAMFCLLDQPAVTGQVLFVDGGQHLTMR